MVAPFGGRLGASLPTYWRRNRRRSRSGEGRSGARLALHSPIPYVRGVRMMYVEKGQGTAVGQARRDDEIARLTQEILSMASHDLKTPATVVKLRAQLLRRKVESGSATAEDLQSGLDTVVRQADRMVQMLTLLLDFSRLEAGHMVLEPAPVDLVEVVGAAVEEVRATTDRHRLTVRAPDGVTGVWDELRLKEVLTNLLTNAMKYSPDGGTVEVEVEVSRKEAIARVRDHGLGVPHEELPNIFERFYRAPSARRLEGTGLGLYICREIIAAHGGRIWAESEGPGHGSTFCFALPLPSTDPWGEGPPRLTDDGPRS